MKKIVTSAVCATMLISATSTFAASAEDNSYTGSKQVTQENVSQVKEMIDIINTLDTELNMYDLSKNNQQDIEKLDKESQEFYYLYKGTTESSQPLTQEAMLGVLNSYVQSSQESNQSNMGVSSIGSIKKYNFSNSEVNTIIDLVADYGTGWAFVTALAKAFGKNPTALTLLIVAVPALGATAIKRCNSKSKGIVITDTRIGATHSYTCTSR